MTLIVSTFAYEDGEPCVERVDDGIDRILWADEVNGGWGMSEEQESRVIECGGIEHRGSIVIELSPPKVASPRVKALVRAWDAAAIEKED